MNSFGRDREGTRVVRRKETQEFRGLKGWVSDSTIKWMDETIDGEGGLYLKDLPIRKKRQRDGGIKHSFSFLGLCPVIV